MLTVGPDGDPQPPTPLAPAAATVADYARPEASFDPLTPLPAPRRMPAGSTMARIQARGRLIVGTSGDKPLMGARDARTGDLIGVDIDLSREIARAIFGDPDRVEFRTVGYAARETLLRTGQVDMVAHSMTMTCDRWQREAFSAEYFRNGQRIMARSDSPVRQVEDLAGQRVCVAKGTTIDNLRHFPGLIVVAVDDAADCQVLFERGEVDAVTSNEVVLRGYTTQDPYARIVGRNLTSEPRGLALPSGQGDMVRFANAVLARLRSDGTLGRIGRKHLPTADLAAVVRPPTNGRRA